MTSSDETSTRGDRPAGLRNAAATYTGEVVPTVDAASVLVVRDGTDAPEVLLVERHGRADFAGGAFVFPGGKVSDADRDLDATRYAGVDPAAWARRLGTDGPRDALGLLVAAVRETFEEAGILLAHRKGRPLSPDEVVSPGFVHMREQLSDRSTDTDWRGWLDDEDLVLDLGALELWAWWVTPEGQHKRFDTRFFVARLPDGQSAHHDDVETTALRWADPTWALGEQAAGRAKIIFPTRRILASLATFEDAASAIAAAAAGKVDQRRIQPRLERRGDQMWVHHPYDGTAERI